MKIINCKKCGALFSKKLRNICEKCLELENENVEKVTKYISSCPERFVSINKISKDLGIMVHEIEAMYKNGRFLSVASRISTNCKSCGVEIKDINSKGFFCDKCITQMGGSTERRAINDPTKVKVTLRQFDKDIMHSAKKHTEDVKFKYGFKKSYD